MACDAPPNDVRVSADVLAHVCAAARDAAPREACLALGGRMAGEAVLVDLAVPMANVAADDDTFAVDAAAFAAAEHALREAGRSWLGFAHSHPRGEALPSDRDREQLWRGCVQLIVGGDGRTVRGWWLRGEPAQVHALRLATIAPTAPEARR